MPRLVTVAVPVPFLGLLTYSLPDHLADAVRGARVLVPLGPRQVTGCIVAFATATEDVREIKDVVGVLDPEGYLPGHVVDLALWAAEYYAAGPGEAVAAAMPPFAWMASERRVTITDAGRDRLARGGAADTRTADQVLRALAGGAALSPRDLAQAASATGSLDAVLRSLARDGLVAIGHSMRGTAAAFRTARVAALTAQGQEMAALVAGAPGGQEPDRAVRLVRGQRQVEALAALRGAPEGLAASALRERGVGPDTLQRLVSRGWVAVRRERVERDPFESAPASAGDAPRRTLTEEQAAALATLTPRVAAGDFHVALLHGVTGSGKTEVYVRLAGQTLSRGRRVLVLVPEIALTPAVAATFRDAFGSRVAIQHSGLSDGERHDQWHRIRDRRVDIVVGTRSAVYAPLEDTGLIIVDEEHDTSYKQEETPRYNGRDLAIVRARQAGALVVLGSATPSMESYRNALEGRYDLVRLERRVLDRPLAAVRVVNMRDELASQGPDVILSGALVDALGRRLGRREQALLLLNRRGFSTSVFCRQCGATLDCPNCSVSLTVHHPRGGSPRARCHYCNHSAAVPRTCSNCAAPYLEHVGFGTEKVEAEMRRLLPDARVARVDRDTMQRRGAIQAVLARFARGEIDVIVGTQMIAKGHDFPAVTLVGVISADVGLGLPDFRASERTFQLLTQVAGRAGRGDIAGEAYIQTLFPDHYSIQLACRQEYRRFYDQEITFRKAMRYPPLVALVNAVVRGRSFGRAMADAGDLASRLRVHAEAGGFRVLGPAPAPLGKLRGEYRAQIFLKGTRRTVMREAVQQALAASPELQRRVTVDVDPLSVL